MARALALILTCGLAFSHIASAEQKVLRGAVYRYVGQDGKVHYTNVRPKDEVSSTLLFSYVETAAGLSWQSLGIGADGAERLVNVRDKKRDGELASIWVMTNYPKVTVLPSTQIALRSHIDLWKVNCATDENWQAERVGYTEEYGAGEVVGQWKFYVEVSTAIPGTFGALVVKEACRISPPAETPKADGPDTQVSPKKSADQAHEARADE